MGAITKMLRPGYRREIDGLRAIAVLPVILFHAGFSTFSGGFIGVDIFFVISGYLITTIILSEIESNSFSILRFYEKRARRILPALFIMLLITVPFAWEWMLPEEFQSYSETLLSTVLFSSNVLFYKTSGYFDSPSELKPLLHTWSLAVEEQFYILYPIFLILATRFCKKITLYLIALLTILSTLFAQWGSFAHPSFTFFMLPTRGFEILIGGITAFLIKGNFLQKKVRFISEVGSMAGLVLIIYAIIFFDKNVPTPSFYTLIPTIGASLVILFSCEKNIIGRLLSCNAIVGLGLISYSSYLWHQPILAFLRIRYFNDLSNLVLIFGCCTSLALGYLSWRFIEAPFRDQLKIPLKKLLLWTASCSIFLLSIGIYGLISDGAESRFSENEKIFTDTIPFKPSEDIRSDYCHLDSSFLAQHSANCIEDTRPSIALWGDSHAASLYPGLKKLQHENKFGITQLTAGSCGPIFNLGNAIRKKNYDSINSNSLKLLIDSQPDVLIIHGAWHHWDYPLSTAELNEKFSSTLKLLKQTLPNTTILIIGPVPRWKVSPQRASYASWLDNGKNINLVPNRLNADKLPDIEEVLKIVSKDYGAKFISATNIFCNDEGCLTRIGNDKFDFVQTDYAHLSKKGSEYFIFNIKEIILDKN